MTRTDLLITTLRPHLIRYFRRRAVKPNDAEDLAHDLIVRLLTRSHAPRAADPCAYIFTAAANLLKDRLRRARLERSLFDATGVHDTGVDSDRRSPDRILAAEQDLDHVAAALSELTDRTRSVFLLRRIEQLKHRDIAGRLGISRRVVARHLTRAAARLQQCAR